MMQGTAQVVSTRLVADLETPVSAMLKLARNARYSFLLESVEGGAVRGRYSIIGMQPDVIWRSKAARPRSTAGPCSIPTARSKPSTSAAARKRSRALLAESRIALPEDAPPMAAGVFGYMGYDMVRLMEELPPPNPDTLGLPDGMLIRPTIMAIFDSVKDEVTVVTPVYPEDGDQRQGRLCARHGTALQCRRGARPAARSRLCRALRYAADQRRRAPTRRPTSIMAMVLKAKDYIAAGDIFQVVLSQRFETEFTLPPFALYRSLRRVNPSPFLYYLDFDRLRDHRLIAGNPGAGARWQGDHPADRRHAAARRDAARRPGPGRGTACRSQGARRTSDAARSRPQRCRPRRRNRLDQGHRPVHPRISTAR